MIHPKSAAFHSCRFVACTALCACTANVVDGVDEREANRAVAALADRGIAAEKTKTAGEQTFSIEVPADDGARAVAALQEDGLPEPRAKTVLESLSGGGLVPSRTAEHERLLAGIAGELETTLREIDRIVSARVHLAAPRKDPLNAATAVSPTASVLIRHHGDSPISEEDVKRLVSAAVPSLSPDAVTVVEVSVPKTAATIDVVRLGPFSTTKATARRVRWFVGGVAAVQLGLVACLVSVWVRLRRLRPKPDETGGTLAREAR